MKNTTEMPITGTLNVTNGGISRVAYKCEKHGDVERHIFTSHIPGHEGSWCLKCVVEKFDELGINRVEKI